MIVVRCGIAECKTKPNEGDFLSKESGPPLFSSTRSASPVMRAGLARYWWRILNGCGDRMPISTGSCLTTVLLDCGVVANRNGHYSRTPYG